MSNATVGLRLDHKTQERLRDLGKKRDRSPHYLMKEAIEGYLDQEEAIEAERELTKERWEKYALAGDSLSHEDVKDWARGLLPAKETNRGK